MIYFEFDNINKISQLDSGIRLPPNHSRYREFGIAIDTKTTQILKCAVKHRRIIGKFDIVSSASCTSVVTKTCRNDTLVYVVRFNTAFFTGDKNDAPQQQEHDKLQR